MTPSRSARILPFPVAPDGFSRQAGRGPLPRLHEAGRDDEARELPDNVVRLASFARSTRPVRAIGFSPVPGGEAA